MRAAARFDGDERLLELPMRLDAGVEAELLDASEPDQIVGMLDNPVPEQYRAIPFAECFDFIERRGHAAQELKIDSTIDRSLHCALALLYGEEFSRDDQWKDGLGRVSCWDISLEELARTLDASEV